MVREVYKMFCKKYYIAMLLLLLIPALFGLGYFFNLSYIIDSGENAGSALGYCSEMQTTIKYFYFLVVIFLACDIFAGEMEEGQIRTVIVHMASRKKVLLQKYTAFCFLMFVFHTLFWVFNAGIYCLCAVKNHKPIVFAENTIITYIGIFWGYLEAFFLCGSVAFLIGTFFRKIYSLVFVYFIWFACRYVNELVRLKSVSTEFMADYLSSGINSINGQNLLCYWVNLLLCIGIVCISLCLFQRKDVS